MSATPTSPLSATPASPTPQVVEIVALVAENSFTNYLNEVAKTDIDFPVVHASEVAKAA